MISILTEGTHTEPGYFRHLSRIFPVNRFQIVPPVSSDPLRLVQQARLLQEKPWEWTVCETSPGEPHEVWIVFDAEPAGRDPTRRRRLQKSLDQASAFGIKMALLSPFFELWLLLHLRSLPAGSVWPPEEILRLLQRHTRLSSRKIKADFPYAEMVTPESVQHALAQPLQSSLPSLIRRLIHPKWFHERTS
jgi:hypothetical protein